VFNGTFVTRGSAKGIVVSTAENTEFGKIAELVKGTRKSSTPLQRKIAQFVKTLMIAIFALGALNLLLGYLVGFNFSYSFLATIALIVAAVPEMLPMLVTSILALSASAMARKNALIRLLPAAETLGSTTVICSDKTGTLTKNEMTVVKVYSGEKEYSVSGAGYHPSGEFSIDGKSVDVANESILAECIKAGLFCSNATLANKENRYEIIGDPTEGALVVAAAKAGITEKSERLDEIPFESDRMYMATLHKNGKSNLLYFKGSPETILKMCRYQLTDNGIENIKTTQTLNKAEELA
jgi:P-type Ca2+ transporter type 2C